MHLTKPHVHHTKVYSPLTQFVTPSSLLEPRSPSAPYAAMAYSCPFHGSIQPYTSPGRYLLTHQRPCRIHCHHRSPAALSVLVTKENTMQTIYIVTLSHSGHTTRTVVAADDKGHAMAIVMDRERASCIFGWISARAIA